MITLVLLTVVILSNASASASVSCGLERASSCSDCPYPPHEREGGEGHVDWCLGDCLFVNGRMGGVNNSLSVKRVVKRWEMGDVFALMPCFHLLQVATGIPELEGVKDDF
eukprot:GFUD01109682.1.p1 GENE.GFUD01109682.1~~GFUD01109682.1.p1  ORF type:complete len:110 (-),score=22.40 GFUD01109682.1:185-514(-)